MKNSKEYSQKVQKLYRSLQKKYKKPEKPQYDDPVEALVLAVLLENFTEPQAHQGIKNIKKHYVDYNDLRAASVIETAEVLDGSARAKKAGIQLYHALNSVFYRHNRLSLKPLLKAGKRQAKQNLEKYEHISHFAANYIALAALDAHAVPLTDLMVEFLRENELVHPEADQADIEGFLTRLVSADQAYEFYALLRQASEEPAPKAAGEKPKAVKKKTKTKKTIRKKTAKKKTVTKKKTGKTTKKTKKKTAKK